MHKAALKQYIPTDEEIAAIMEVDDKESLNIADKYFLEVTRLPLISRNNGNVPTVHFVCTTVSQNSESCPKA
jgi:hypothetical protein